MRMDNLQSDLKYCYITKGFEIPLLACFLPYHKNKNTQIITLRNAVDFLTLVLVKNIIPGFQRILIG